MRKNTKFVWLAASAPLLALAVVSPSLADDSAADARAVISTYADIAHASYEDSAITAQTLDAAIDALIASPNMQTLATAKSAWLAARVPYQQTEAYRFGNAIVDDWEGRVNAWPLDEGLIDYVEASYGTESDENPLYSVNIVANASLSVGGETIDAANLTPDLLQSLHEAGDVESNVTTGYHAIEFLLWGQDLNGTSSGSGARPHTDFDADNCTGGNCARRAAYLKAASELLIRDLEEMVANWAEGGSARAGLMSGSREGGLATILAGMGSLSYGELAGERMKLGLLLHDPEEEHDCFSDNTHNSHFYDSLGIQNVYLGRYIRIDGSIITGASLSDLVSAADADVDAALRDKLDATMVAMTAMRRRAENIETYDQMIGAGNDTGNGIVQAAIDALLDQTEAIEGAIHALGLQNLTFEGSDSLDDPGGVFD